MEESRQRNKKLIGKNFQLPFSWCLHFYFLAYIDKVDIH